MLILSRKTSEKIYIGDDMWVMVVEIDRNKVKLGIHAPGKQVDREEVREARAAIQADPAGTKPITG